MTVIMEQVEAIVPTEFSSYVDLGYADDTALISDDVETLQVVFHTLLEKAKCFGLQPNMDKTLHLQVRHSAEILDPWGAAVKTTAKAKYLGGILSADGTCTSAVVSRLGEGRSVFQNLLAIWKHSTLPLSRKLAVFRACVLSKLMYSLEVYCLKKHERDKLDAFHAMCLRRILRIPHPMLSHISNKTVFERAEAVPFSVQLIARQVSLFNKIAALPNGNLLRSSIFNAGSNIPRVSHGPRRQGRPRLSWATVAYAHARTDADVLPNAAPE